MREAGVPVGEGAAELLDEGAEGTFRGVGAPRPLLTRRYQRRGIESKESRRLGAPSAGGDVKEGRGVEWLSFIL